MESALHRKFIVAFDSFKGCMSSEEANAAAAEGLRRRYPDAEIITIPASDGGEGWVAAWHRSMSGELITVPAHDALMRSVMAQYLRRDETAIIEVAQAVGLTMLAPEERNPLIATSFGVGEMIVDAYRKGCREFIIGLGGSATSDCGRGMLKGLMPLFGRYPIDSPLLKECRFVICSDVRNPLYGNYGAAAVFAPQKGADDAMVARLDRYAKRFAHFTTRKTGRRAEDNHGAGAAGGLGYAFMQYLNAEACCGAEVLLDRVGINELMKDATYVVTGEGCSDTQTVCGKFPAILARYAAKHHVAVALLSGKIKDKELLLRSGFKQVLSINPPDLPLAEAMKPEIAKKLLTLQTFSPKF
jgi:glycerate kinase